MKQFLVILVPFVLLACSSKGVQQMPQTNDRVKAREIESSVAESGFQESSGTLNLAFDAKGNWLRITAKSTAVLGQDSPAGRDSALMVATMRAKRTVAEFLNNDVKSVKTLNRLGKSYAKNFQSAENQESPLSEDSEALTTDDTGGKRSEQSRQAQRFAELLSERIQDSSAAIIRGGYVSYHAFEQGQAVVELTVSRESVGAARQLSRIMAGGLK